LPNNFAEKIFYLLLHPMKIVPNSLLTLLAFLFSLVNCNAAAIDPPPPSPPPPPGLPIDSGIVVLLCAAILLGIYKLNQIRLNKTSL
jgi:hypothetical protein